MAVVEIGYGVTPLTGSLSWTSAMSLSVPL